MAESKNFVAVGKEAVRGTKEVSTVSFLPVRSFALTEPDYGAKKRDDFRGEETRKGATAERRMLEKWEGLSLEMEGFSEGGTVKEGFGWIFRHFMGGGVAPVQNAATGQYAVMHHPEPDMFTAARLDDDALTLSMNAMHEATLTNHPYTGGRVGKLTFKQEMGDDLIITADCFGQRLLTPEAGLVSPAYPPSNLRLLYNNMTIRRAGTVTRTGAAPDYSNIASDGEVVKVDSMSLDLDFGKTDKIVGNGTNTPGKTTIGIFTGTLSLTIDFANPATGFSSVNEFMAFLAGTSETNFLLTWDTGTQAGTGDNHALIIDLPRCNRLGGMPSPPRDGEPTITLKYDLLLDETTTLYGCGILQKNTAANV